MRTRHLHVHASGLDHVPKTGPALLVARHYHHLYDGAALVTSIPRPLHVVVGLDWCRTATERTWWERLCRGAGWPIVLRDFGDRPSAYRPDERLPYLRRAMREVNAYLRAGELVVVFAEGYPNVDPAYTPKRDDASFLPFAAGYRRMLAQAARDGVTVPLLPVGFRYERGGKRERVEMRIGEPVTVDAAQDAVVSLSRG